MNDRIHIAYPSGHMDLVLSQFFPCTVRQARIVFPLINTYAEALEKEKLRQHLTQYANEKKESMKEMEADYQCGRRRPGRNYRQMQTFYKRAIRNLEFLED